MLQSSDITQIVLFLLRLPDRVLIDNITVTPAFWNR
jgi:NADP-dependent 3-hydroxy acid dehydrogenase YdfG